VWDPARELCVALTFGARPERNRDYYLKQISLLLLELTVNLMPQSDHMFNPNDCQIFRLCWMHLIHIIENALCILLPAC